MALKMSVAVLGVVLQLGACRTTGAYVSRSEQSGQLLSLSTASCEQSCRHQFAEAGQLAGGGKGYGACLAACPDVVFLDEAVCAPAHRMLCEPSSHVDGTRTTLAVLVGAGIVAYVVAMFALISVASSGGST